MNGYLYLRCSSNETIKYDIRNPFNKYGRLLSDLKLFWGIGAFKNTEHIRTTTIYQRLTVHVTQRNKMYCYHLPTHKVTFMDTIFIFLYFYKTVWFYKHSFAFFCWQHSSNNEQTIEHGQCTFFFRTCRTTEEAEIYGWIWNICTSPF